MFQAQSKLNPTAQRCTGHLMADASLYYMGSVDGCSLLFFCRVINDLQISYSNLTLCSSFQILIERIGLLRNCETCYLYERYFNNVLTSMHLFHWVWLYITVSIPIDKSDIYKETVSHGLNKDSWYTKCYIFSSEISSLFVKQCRIRSYWNKNIL